MNAPRKVTLCVLIGATLAAGCRKGSAEGEAEAEIKPVVTVKIATASSGTVDMTVRAPATIFPRERVSISSNLTTPIRTLYARKGDRVQRGQLLALLEDRDLAAQRGEAEAAVRQADVMHARRADLFARGAIPQRDLLTTETDLAQSRARLDKIDATLRFTKLRSPFAGVIVDQFLYAGDVIRPDTPVFTVVDMAVAVARAQVPAAAIAGIRVGQRATFTSKESGQDALAGRISMVNQAVDPARRTVEVWCEIDNHAGVLRDGTFGEIAIATGASGTRVMVPRAAVQFEHAPDGTENDNAGTTMVVTGGVAHKRALETSGDGDPVAIVKGLAAGEKVVIEGGYGLPDGTQVRLAPDAAAGAP